MKDYLNQELQVGDWVVFVDASNSTGFFIGPIKIDQLKPGKNDFVHFKSALYTKKTAKKVLKVSEEVVIMYQLKEQ